MPRVGLATWDITTRTIGRHRKVLLAYVRKEEFRRVCGGDWDAPPRLWRVLARFGYGLGSGLGLGLGLESGVGLGLRLRPYLDPNRNQNT